MINFRRSLSAIVVTTLLTSNAQAMYLGFQPYNQEAINELKSLARLKKSEHKRVLRAHKSLQTPSYASTMPPPQINDEAVFTADAPRITGLGTSTPIPCSVVEYADKSAKYLMRRFSPLHNQAITLLDTPNKDAEYQDVLNELLELLTLLEAAYPDSFRAIDRRAEYQFLVSEQLRARLSHPNARASGEMQVSAIKFGPHDWVPIHAGITGLMNFEQEPLVVNGQITVSRLLTPMEACLDDLTLKLEGTVHTHNEYGFISEHPAPERVPDWRRRLPGRRIINRR